MAQEIRTHQSNSTKIPTFNAFGSGPETRYPTLPPFNKAANNIDTINFPEQFSNTNYPARPVNYFAEIPTNAHNAKQLYEKKQEAFIDLTISNSHQVQMPVKTVHNHRTQPQSNLQQRDYNSQSSNFANGSYMTQQIKTDPSHAKFSLDANYVLKKQGHASPQLGYDVYQKNQLISQQKAVTTATNTPHKSSTDYTKQFYTPTPHNNQFPPFHTNSIPGNYTRPATRDAFKADIQMGETAQNNNMFHSQTQHSSYQYNGYNKELSKPQYIDNSIQNTGFNPGYSSTQHTYQVKQMDKKQEVAMKRLPNMLHQDVIGGRPMQQNEVLMNTYRSNLVNNGTSKSAAIENGLVLTSAHKSAPVHARYQMVATQDLQTMPKPMTTPRPTTIPEGTSWVPPVYDYNHNNNNGSSDYTDALTNVMEELIKNNDFTKFNHLPEDQKHIQRIKEELLMDPFPQNNGYFPQELTARKRQNEVPLCNPESSKKQTLQSKYQPYTDSGMFDNSHNIASPPLYSDQSIYEMSQNGNHPSYQSLYMMQSNYQLSNEMNHIVPTSNNQRASPSSYRNHDSPGADPLMLKKRRDNEQDETNLSF